MALIDLDYCNASLGRYIDLKYDNVSHTINQGIATTPCSPGLQSDVTLYTHVDGIVQYTVRTKNSAPYAYVSQAPAPGCAVVISNIVVTNASTNKATNGKINIVAQTSNVNTIRSYSIDDGVTYRAFGLFSNLAPGVYKVRVRGMYLLAPGQPCYDTDTVVVGYNDVVCELKLGNITSTQPTIPGGADGKIVVNTLVDPIGLAVQYRLDAGVWQDSPEFPGLLADTYNVQVRYKDFPTCGDNRDVEVYATVGCDLHITDVIIVHEQSRFADDGQLQIIAAGSNGGHEYSIDDGVTYQNDNLFLNLSPGTYNVRVKDSENCTDTRVVEVFPFKTPYIDFPEVNGHRFVLTNAPGFDNTLPTDDNRLFADQRRPGVDPSCYWELVDRYQANRRFQFRSNWTEHTLRIYKQSDDSLVATLAPIKVKDFTRQVVELTGYLADAGANKTQLFFETGLPEWASIGQAVTISDTAHSALNHQFEIEAIQPGILQAEGYSALILPVVFPAAGIVQCTVTVEYDIEPFDVWEAVINWADLPNGKYYMILEGTDVQFTGFSAESEPVHLETAHDDCVYLTYANIDNNFKIFYDTGIEHVMVLRAEFGKPNVGGEEVNHEDSRGRLIKLQENITVLPELFAPWIPPYLAIRLACACAHDSLKVNGVEYGKQDEKVKIDYFDEDMLCNSRIRMRKKDFMAENSDDAGDVDVPKTVLEVNGILLRINP
jgi:hypothetical protein